MGGVRGCPWVSVGPVGVRGCPWVSVGPVGVVRPACSWSSVQLIPLAWVSANSGAVHNIRPRPRVLMQPKNPEISLSFFSFTPRNYIFTKLVQL